MSVDEYVPNVEDEKVREPFNLYQIQIKGLKKGWLIYPKTLNPLTLIIKLKRKSMSTCLKITPEIFDTFRKNGMYL